MEFLLDITLSHTLSQPTESGANLTILSVRGHSVIRSRELRLYS